MISYTTIYSLAALLCVHHFSSGTAINRPARSADTKCDELEKPGWTVEQLANITLDSWPRNCLNAKYNNVALGETIKNVCTDLHDAASKGYIGFVQYYVEDRKMPINEGNTDKLETPLHLAAQKGHSNIVKYIASKLTPIELNTINEESHTPVMSAAYFGHLDIVKYLLNDLNADQFFDDSDKRLMLRLAARGGHLPVLKYLIDERNYFRNNKGKDLHIFYDAASGGNVDLIKYLLYDKDLEKTVLANGQNWALHKAASKGKLAAMQFFVDNLGFSVNLKDDNDETPVLFAVPSGSLPAVKYLVEKGADFNIRNHYGETPLHLAALQGHLPIVKYLVDERNVSIEVEDDMIRTPVHRAVHENRLDVVKYLLKEKNAYRYQRSSDGRTLLHQAVYAENVDMMKYLINDAKMSSQIDVGDLVDSTPAREAASLGRLDILKFLIDEKHANITIVDREGRNVLHAAAMSCNLEVVKYLVEDKGLDVNLKTPSGKNAYDFATDCDYYKKKPLLAYLEKKMN